MSCGNISTGSSAKPMPLDIPVAATSWTPCYRIIPSRFPPIGLFEKVADPDDLEAVFQIEAMTNDRLRDEVGVLALVPPDDRVSGPRSEEHTSELQSLMRISYAVFCLKKKN